MTTFKTVSLSLPTPAIATMSEWRKANRLDNEIIAEFEGKGEFYRLPADREDDLYTLWNWLNDFNGLNPLAQKPKA